MNDAGNGLATAKRWINRAMNEIQGEEAWPFLEVSETGTAPLTLAANPSGRVETVYDDTNNRSLIRRSRRDLQEEYADDLTLTGVPYYWYRSDVGTINVFPVQAVSLKVRYFKYQTDLSASGDTPLMPARFHMAIVDLAASYAHRSNGNLSLADSLAADVERVVGKMREELIGMEPMVVPLVGEDV
jgi:hypothetical protein